MVSEREEEKLKAIGYPPFAFGDPQAGETNWPLAKLHAQSPEGMKATMADKVRWLMRDGVAGVEFYRNVVGWEAHLTDTATVHRSTVVQEHGASPEAAVDALFWKVL